MTMFVRSISVIGLFNEFDYTIELCSPLTFIHSANGMGKSTIMRMLYASLRGDLDYLKDTPFERMDVSFDDGSDLIMENDGEDLHIHVRKSEVSTVVSSDAMANLCPAIYLSPERLTMKKGDGHIAPTLDVFAQELLETVRYAKEHRALEAVATDAVAGMSDGDLEFWCKDLKAKLDFMKDAGFEPDMPSGTKFPPSRYDISRDRRKYEELSCSISEYACKNYQLAESIIIFKDIVNEIFINKTIAVSDAGRLTVSMDNGTALQLQKLSSGEKQILIMFYVLLFHTSPGTLVILDEPEISLHVVWQQMLSGYFLDICRVRSIQMIVSTHSPQVIHDKWDLARELKGDDARASDSGRHLQPDGIGEGCLRWGVRGRRRDHRPPSLRQVHRQGQDPSGGRPLQGQCGALRQGDEHSPQGSARDRHRRFRSGPPRRERSLPSAVPYGSARSGDDDSGRGLLRRCSGGIRGCREDR